MKYRIVGFFGLLGFILFIGVTGCGGPESYEPGADENTPVEKVNTQTEKSILDASEQYVDLSEPSETSVEQADSSNPTEGKLAESTSPESTEDSSESATEHRPEGWCKAGSIRMCYSGPANTSGKGACKVGYQVCKEDASWGLCKGMVLPSKELCDGKDNDCDGKTDESFPLQGGTCLVSGKKGACAKGSFSCNQGKLSCSQKIQPAKEMCNGLDDDCDGTIDTTFPEKGRACKITGEKGICANGVYACTQGKLNCTKVHSPQKERCNGLDDNCDGSIDESYSEKGKLCSVPGKLGPCGEGLFQCKLGKMTCIQKNIPKKEVCNGVDDDCNGLIDDTFPEQSKSCAITGLSGICAQGRYHCTKGALKCHQATKPLPEVCDGKDNDCDGKVDNNPQKEGHDCTVSGGKGPCSLGTHFCRSGKVVCTPSFQASKEFCNGLDDDCNGLVNDKCCLPQTPALVLPMTRLFPNAITAHAWHVDNKTLFVGDSAGSVFQFEQATKKLLRRFDGHPDSILQIIPSLDKKHLVTKTRHSVFIWSISTSRLIRKLDGSHPYVSHTGTYVLVSYPKQDLILVWDTSTQKLQKHALSEPSVVLSLSQDEKTLILYSRKTKSIQLWSFPQMKFIRGFALPASPRLFADKATFVANGTQLLIYSDSASASNRYTGLFDLKTGKLLRSFTGKFLALQLKETAVVTSSWMGSVLWELKTAKKLKVYGMRPYGRVLPAFRPQDASFVFLSGLKNIEFWDTLKNQSSGRWSSQGDNGHSAPVRGVVVTSDGKRIVTASEDKSIKIWNGVTGKLLRMLSGHTTRVTALSLSPNDKYLASAGETGLVLAWELASGKRLGTVVKTGGQVHSMAFSPDSRVLALPIAGRFALYTFATRKLLRYIGSQTNRAYSLDFAPDGKHIASGTQLKTIQLWEVASGKLVRSLTGHRGQVTSVRFSKNGQFLASGGSYGDVHLWEPSTGKKVFTLLGHNTHIHGLAFRPDNQTLASASSDKKIILWNVRSGRKLHTLVGHGAAVTGLQWRSDDKGLISSSSDATARLWKCP